MKLRLLKSLSGFAFAMFASLPLVASAAPVKTISLEVFKDAETPFWEVSVSCENIATPRTMNKALDGVKWCSSEITALCDENKFSLSRQLCSDNYDQLLVDFQNGKPLSLPVVTANVEAEPTTTAKAPADVQSSKPKAESQKSNDLSNDGEAIASRDNLLKEQMQIEEQRILIQQKRLELRRRELALQKRQLGAS